MKVSAVIAAGGRGRRMGMNKQFITIAGVPMVVAAASAFERSVDEIVIVVPKRDVERTRKLVRSFKLGKVRRIVEAGPHRQDSVYKGLAAVSSDTDYILIHDGARPLITVGLIKELIAQAKRHGAAILAVPVIDTVKKAAGGFISDTLERRKLWAAQTPQAFRASLIRKAHEKARRRNFRATDDASLVEKLGHKVKIVMGSYDNIKVTTPFDLKIVEILKRRGLR